MKHAVEWAGLVLTVIAALCQQLAGSSFSPLYTTSDPGLVILDNSNFTSHLSHRSTGFFVEFYNTWCGHCIKFAPIFKEFARDVHNWSSVVQLAVLDCAEDRNHEICRDYEIYMYPSLRFFHSNYTPMRDYSKPKPDSFTPISNLTGVYYEGEFDSPATLRRHLIDMIRQNENSTELKQKLDQIISEESVSQAGHPGRDGQVKPPDQSHASSSSHSGSSVSTSPRVRENAITPVHMDDLFNALRYSIYNQVTMHQKLNSSQLEALKSFLRVVDEYFTFDDFDAR
jgi:thiol-disulfide isomerase/thioredoxin